MQPGSDAWRSAYEVGERYEATLDPDARDRGAHYTPPDVAEQLVERALEAWGRGAPIVCDPSCGGGAFLVAAAEQLRRRGIDPATVVERHVVGVDLDAGAVAAAREALTVWARSYGVLIATPRVILADGLSGGLPQVVGHVDVVVGNPPFQSQLAGSTTRTTAERDALAARFGALARGYVDSAAIFVAASIGMVGSGGVVTLIQPQSFLVARDARAVREAVIAAGSLTSVWVPGEQVFAASVDVCAVTVRVGPPGASTVVVVGGRDGSVRLGQIKHAELSGAPTWSPVWAAAQGVPTVGTQSGGVVADLASATAGFRDEYYGLIPHITDERPTDGRRLVTTAMIDPANDGWSIRPVRIGGTGRVAPWLDCAALAEADARLARWVDRLSVPKVLVATQTRVVEAVADPAGDAVPLTPVIAVVPNDPADVLRLEAALLAPAATAWALRRFGGGAMSASGLKLAARQVLEIPLPSDREAWEEGVAHLREPSEWRQFGALMSRAWGLHGPEADDLVEWWLDRGRTSLK